MDPRRLLFLHELARLGSMQRVADELNVTTSTVSQQIAVLGRELRVRLIEPEGRRVRLTPAGRRLADHAATILAAIDAARRDLGSDDPGGTVAVAGFATGIRHALIPAIRRLAAEHPRITLHVREHEPPEAVEALAAGTVDLALVYDYTLAPIRFDRTFDVARLWTAPWSLGVPAQTVDEPFAGLDAPGIVHRYRDHRWIVNSRNTADEDLLRIMASMAGFEPEIAHRADSLDLVQDLITSGQGIGLLPADGPIDPDIRLLPLANPAAVLRAFAVTRRGHTQWAPLAIVRDLLTEPAATASVP
ncbi:MAG TPA: LysR family transcriptional regulator [Nakamurella sp.]|jgi:DNA-binding transcriptional LysR family regulator